MKYKIVISFAIILIGCKTNPIPVNDKVIKKTKINSVDSAKLSMDLSLRRLNSVFAYNEANEKYWENSSLYYQTEIDKYRIIANSYHKKCDKIALLEKAQRDSLENIYHIK